MSSELIIHASDASFEQDVLKSDVPVLLDFWAPWCGPCKMIAPILDDIASEFQGRLKSLKSTSTTMKPLLPNSAFAASLP